MKNKNNARKIRHLRIRKKVEGDLTTPRLVVFKSNKNFYANLVDDSTGKILATSSTMTLDLKNANKEAAAKIGHDMAKKIKALKIEAIVFDRGGYIYHGKIAQMCDVIRKEGIKF